MTLYYIIGEYDSLTKALVRSRKAWGSIVVSIPKKVNEHEGIREGELIEIDVRKS